MMDSDPIREALDIFRRGYLLDGEEITIKTSTGSTVKISNDGETLTAEEV